MGWRILWQKNSFWKENQDLYWAALSPQLECEMRRKLSSPSDSTQKNSLYNRLFFCQLSRESDHCGLSEMHFVCHCCVVIIEDVYDSIFLVFFFLPDVCCCNYFFFTLCNRTTTKTSYDPNHLKHKVKWLSFDLETFLMDCTSFCLHSFSIVRKTIC